MITNVLLITAEIHGPFRQKFDILYFGNRFSALPYLLGVNIIHITVLFRQAMEMTLLTERMRRVNSA